MKFVINEPTNDLKVTLAQTSGNDRSVDVLINGIKLIQIWVAPVSGKPVQLHHNQGYLEY